MFKRFITSLFCLFLILNCSTFIVFAEGESNVPDGYSPCGLNDQVDAFKSYCQSRNLIVEGSGLDVVTSFTTNAYQGAVTKVGLDINQLQNEIYKRTKDNKGAKWFFTSTGVSAYNRIFAELLQNNDLEVGESVANKTVYDGKAVNGNLVYYVRYSGNTELRNNLVHIVQEGTKFETQDYFYNTRPQSISYGGNTYNITYYSNSGTNVEASVSGGTPFNYIIDTYPYGIGGFTCLFINTQESHPVVRYGFINIAQGKSFHGDENTWKGYTGCTTIATISSSQVENANVYYTTNNTVINNNNYEGDTYITNEGDVNPPVETPPGGKNPGWNVGGGQGSYNDGQGNNYTINFPDFELPDLNIDWSIQGLGNKFPFSIPFDIVSLVAVLNAEPEAPRFQGTMDLGITTYNYDIDLAQFDSVASACRIAELLLLVFGLIMITRSIIKG